MSSKNYSAPWGLRIWLLTGIVVGLGVAVVVGFLIFKDQKASLLVRLLPLIIVLLVFGGTALFVVRGFELTRTQLLVKRSFWKTVVRLEGLESATADTKALKGAFKTLGNDGLFAMNGRFRSKKLGGFRAFVTDPKNAVILKFAERTVVVSPENPKNFANELNRRLRRQKDTR